MSTEIKTEFVVLTRRDLQYSNLVGSVRKFLRDVYLNHWLGDDSFDNQTLPNTSQALLLTREGKIEGVIPFNGERLMMLGAQTDLIDPKKAGYFPGSLLLGEAVRICPDAWATVSAEKNNGPASMRRLFDRSGFRRVNNLAEVCSLYNSLGNAPHGDQFRSRESENGLVFSHTMSVHDQSNESYWQFAFARPRS